MQEDKFIRLKNDFISFSISVSDNLWRLDDLRAGVSWGNIMSGQPWIAIQYRDTEGIEWQSLKVQAAEYTALEGLHCRLATLSGEPSHISIFFRLHNSALQSYVVPDEGVSFSAMRLFISGLEADEQQGGEALMPVRMGLLIPAHGERPLDLRIGTYEYEAGPVPHPTGLLQQGSAHMAMMGLFKSEAVLMATWADPYVVTTLSRARADSVSRLRLGFELAKTALSLELYCLGKGDLSTLAEAYRQRAKQLGYRVTWEEKIETRPQGRRLLGACNVKLHHALERLMGMRSGESLPRATYSPEVANMLLESSDPEGELKEESVTVNWTFDEAAQVAEHLKHDLQLENVLFHLSGWIRHGYDVRHPDIWPPAPECGGAEGLADCAQRVQACGYLFCLHDNYQDMYPDAPSWDVNFLQKDRDGAPHPGQIWLGGQCFYTCAREAVKLAQRPQNLPAVKEAINPDAYFIDTTFAVGPQECYDPRHPLTRQDDIHWKQVLSDYARDLFGLFGSECGREWAVPYADFFEGLASVSGRYFHRLDPDELGGTPVPFFDMVYRDCIAVHGKYRYDPKEMAEQVIYHIAMGRPLYYHPPVDQVQGRLYWQDPSTQVEVPFPDSPVDPAVYTRAHTGWAEGLSLWDRFMKNTHEVLGPLHKLTAEVLIQRYDFLDHNRLIRRTTFGDGTIVVVNGSDEDYVTDSSLWGAVVLPPYGFLVDGKSFVAFHARVWNGHEYAAPVLFTLASLDSRPLRESNQVRIFHGFGQTELPWRGDTIAVRREITL